MFVQIPVALLFPVMGSRSSPSGGVTTIYIYGSKFFDAAIFYCM